MNNIYGLLKNELYIQCLYCVKKIKGIPLKESTSRNFVLEIQIFYVLP